MVSLSDARKDEPYTLLLENVYKNTSFILEVHENTRPVSMTVSEKEILFIEINIATLEHVFKQLHWQDKSIILNEKRLNNIF